MAKEMLHPTATMPPVTDSADLGVWEHESTGRPKFPPVCISSCLRDKAMSTSQLLELAYEPQTRKAITSLVEKDIAEETALTSEDATMNSHSSCHQELHLIPMTVSVNTSASSCGASTGSLSRDCDVVTLSDCETRSCSGTQYLQESDKLNARIVQRKTSRQGRAWQRWVPADNNVGEPVRLVVGTVPILKDGKILFVSASRKPDWILPKGGWEGDETMEESAVRESFEEAGVIGVLGQALTPVQHETRKSKKRKLEKQSGTSAVCHDDSPPVEKALQVSNDEKSEKGCKGESKYDCSDQCSKIQNQGRSSLAATDETTSVGSTFSTTYSFVKMTLFPLYVTDILSSWPESGRFRTAVDIDEAISIMDARPEFKAVLIEIKTLGLHLVQCPIGKKKREDDYSKKST